LCCCGWMQSRSESGELDDDVVCECVCEAVADCVLEGVETADRVWVDDTDGGMLLVSDWDGLPVLLEVRS